MIQVINVNMTFFVILFLNVSCEDNRSIWKISGLVPQEMSILYSILMDIIIIIFVTIINDQ